MTRTFIALEQDESLQRYLGEIIHHMTQDLPGPRWVDPAGIHLTLAFLGELNDQQLLAVQDRQPRSPLVRVRHLSVMKSELMRAGARYTSLRDVPLGLDKD